MIPHHKQLFTTGETVPDGSGTVCRSRRVCRRENLTPSSKPRIVRGLFLLQKLERGNRDSPTNLFSSPLEKFAGHSSLFSLLRKYSCGFRVPAVSEPTSLTFPSSHDKEAYFVLDKKCELGNRDSNPNTILQRDVSYH